MKTYDLLMFQKNFYEIETIVDHSITDSCRNIIGRGYYDPSGNFDANAMEKAYFELLRRNDAFRIRLVKEEENVRQYVQDLSEFPRPERKNLSDGRESFKALCQSPERPRITLFDPQLTKAVIYTCNDQTGGIIIWQHHICSDGYSMGKIACQQLSDFYSVFREGKIPEEPKKIFSFVDHLEKDLERKKGRFEEDYEWYLKEYNRRLLFYNMPHHYVPEVEENRVIQTEICGERYEALQRIIDRTGRSDSAVFLTAIALMVSGLGKTFRFHMNVETHGRATFAQKNTAGPLLDEPVLFFDIVPWHTLDRMIDDVYCHFMESVVHSQFTALFSEEHFLPKLRRCGLGDVDFEWMEFNNLRGYSSNGSSCLEQFMIAQKQTDNGYDLELEDLPEGNGVVLSFHYDRQLITEERAKEIQTIFLRLFDFMDRCPKATVWQCLKLIRK